jgi:hypothetical protein
VKRYYRTFKAGTLEELTDKTYYMKQFCKSRGYSCEIVSSTFNLETWLWSSRMRVWTDDSPEKLIAAANEIDEKITAAFKK